MATGFIDRFLGFCGRSGTLAVIAGINIILGLLLSLTVHIAGEGSLIEVYLHRMLALSGKFSSFIHAPWTLMTYMVTQFSLLHLLFNVIWLIWFGRLAIFALNEKALLPLYIGGGFTGGIFYIVSGFAGIISPGASLCGASASVLALMTAVAITIPDYKINLFLFGAVKMKWFCIACILLSFIGLGGASGSYGGQLAHIGGAIFGVAFIYFRKLRTNAKVQNLENKEGKKRKLNPAKVIRQASGRLNDTERLDQLLEKISISGYSSLSMPEKRELDAISRHLKRNEKND